MYFYVPTPAAETPRQGFRFGSIAWLLPVCQAEHPGVFTKKRPLNYDPHTYGYDRAGSGWTRVETSTERPEDQQPERWDGLS